MIVVVCSADPPRKRIDVVPLSHANGTPRLSLGNLAEGSPLAPRRALTVQQMYVYSVRQHLLMAFSLCEFELPRKLYTCDIQAVVFGSFVVTAHCGCSFPLYPHCILSVLGVAVRIMVTFTDRMECDEYIMFMVTQLSLIHI